MSVSLLRPALFLLACCFWQNLQAQTHLFQNWNQNSIPSDWQVTDQGTGPCRWKIRAPHFAGVAESINLNGSNFLIVNSDSGGSATVADETITSPVINFGTAGLVRLQFDHYFRYGSTFRRDTAFVEAFDGTNWIRLEAITQTRGSGTAPVRAEYNLSAHLNSQLRIRFRYKGNWAYYWAIDNVRVLTPPAQDAGAELVRISSGPCGLPASVPVKLRVKNVGAAPITSLPARYQVPGGAVVEETFSLNLASGDTSLLTFAVPYQPQTSGAIVFKAWTSLPGDTVPQNDTVSSAVFQRAPSLLAAVSFANFTGSNLSSVLPGWREANGNNPGTSTTSGWTSSNFSQTQALGTATAKVNLFGTGRREWIITSPFNPGTSSVLRFRLAITDFNNSSPATMGEDDSLIVRVSTDCGTSWSRLNAYSQANNIPNALTSFSIPLSAYSGQTIRIAFFATSGTVGQTNDYDVHLDGVEILNPSPVELRLMAVSIPGGTCGVGQDFTFRVRVRNNGVDAQTSIPVFYSFNNQAAASQTVTQTLEAGAEAWVQLTNSVSVPQGGTFPLTVWLQAAGDANPSNDSIRNVPVLRAPATVLPVNFSGFTGTNLSSVFPGWSEANGQNPSGTTSGWTASNAAQTTALGGTTAKINLFNTNQRDWIISPSFVPQPGFVFRFKIALTDYNGIDPDSMGTDDSLLVRITTNCGQTWTRLAAFSRVSGLTNQLVQKEISLEAFAGQSIRVAFFGTDGTVDNANDYDVHIDDLEVIRPSALDAGLSQIVLPVSPICGLPSSLPVQVRVLNNGSQVLNDIPLRYRINGGPVVSATLAGSLAVGAAQTFAFPEPASFSTAGQYRIQAWVAYPGDSNSANDTLWSDTLFRRPAQISGNTFTGFTGSNLAAVFPGWREANGINPGGTFSDWISSSGSQTAFFGSTTARVNLFTNNNREWVISPAYNPVGPHILRFRTAVTTLSGTGSATMGADDSLLVRISTDCGQTWNRLLAIGRDANLNNQLREFSVLISLPANQTAQIGFFATDGTQDNIQDYDLHLDNITMAPAPNTDVGVAGFVLSGVNCGLPESLPVTIQVKNFGALAQSNIPVAYRVSGGAEVNAVFPGPIAPGETLAFTFPTPATFSGGSSFVIRAWTAQPGDAVLVNDTILSPVLSPAPAAIPTVGFTGFDGTNLAQLFPGWEEKRGNTPAGTVSDWLGSNSFQTTEFGTPTARINLLGNTKRDWMISPAFTASATANLRFRVAVTARSFHTPAQMGADDSVNVMVSTDCGTTWTRVRSFTAANNLSNLLTPVTVDLSAFSGQTIRIGFKATDGLIDNTQDYDFHLDDIVADNVVAVEKAVSRSPVLVYPNPVAGEVWIRGIQTGNGPSPQVWSLDGKAIPSVRWMRESDTWKGDLDDLAPGLYFLRFSDDSGRIRTEKIQVLR